MPSSSVLASTDDPLRTARAIEANAAHLLLAMGQAGGGEAYRSSEIEWTIGGSPIDYHNAVVHTDLTAASANSAIQRVISRFREHGVPGSWHVTAAMYPADLGERLLAHGFTSGGSEPCMAADLHALHESLNTPPGLRIRRVQDETGLQQWAQTLALGFGEGEREAFWVRDVYRTIGLGNDAPFRHYLASVGDTPAATASLFLDGVTAGIYFVMTAPQYRRQGLGAAVTLAALREARALGYRVGVLGSSSAGFSVYQRLGFRTFSTMHLYEWHPEPSEP